jgi:endonuclease-3
VNANVSAEQVAAISAGLAEKWPDAVVELDHANAYQLLVATILSAQSTDKMINTLTPAVFARYPDPAALARAEPTELEPMIFSSGFYRAKAKNVIAMARRVVERFAGVVPDTMEGLVDLPGVARKTANVVLGSVFGKNEGVVVDTHVARLAARLGLTTNTDPVKIEQDLMRVVPRDQWSIFAQRLIWHGRRVCFAKKPDCEHCPLAPVCPSAGLGLPALARGSGAKIAQRPGTANRAPTRTRATGKRNAGKPARTSAKNAKSGKPGARIATTGKPAASSASTARSAKQGAATPARARKEQRI